MKINGNILYIEEILIKKMNKTTENAIKTMRKNVDFLRKSRLLLLIRENAIKKHLKLMKIEENLLSFKPKTQVLSYFYNRKLNFNRFQR